MRIDELNKLSTNADILDRKEKFTKKTLSRVILKLKRGPHELLEQYMKIEAAIDTLSKQRSTLNEKLKSEVGDLFAVEEKILTRVIETADFTATLSAEYMKGGKTVTDYEAIVNELTNKLTPVALAMLNNVIEKHTKVNEAQMTIASLKVKRRSDSDKAGEEDEMHEARKVFTHQWLKEESYISKVVDWVKKFARHAFEDIIPRLNAYDLQLERLRIKANLHHQYGKK